MVIKRSASMEDYLESIIMLRKGTSAVKVSQISKALEVKMPSVTSALKKLSRQGLAEHEPYGGVKLTPEGERMAKNVLQRHEALRQFLTDVLDVNPEIAAKDACEMEHAVSPATQQKLVKFVESVRSSPKERLKQP